MSRVVVLGMNNPHSDDPEDALHPSKFPNSAGSRLYQMTREADPSVSEAEYLRALDRRNLFVSREWLSEDAREYAEEMKSGLDDRSVVLLGAAVQGCLRLPPIGFYQVSHTGCFTFVVVPHPSGMNRIYNDPGFRRRTGALVARAVTRGELS